MPAHRIRARPPRDAVRAPATLTQPDEVAVYLQDAARTPGGHASGVSLPRSEGEVVHVLRHASAVLPVGAQSSLTAGATPFGDHVLSLARMDSIGAIGSGAVEVEAGVALTSLEAQLRPRGLFYPPVPTFHGALVGGTAATNAAGAATFKYGSARDWIQALTIVLASGDVLDVERGACVASAAGVFEIDTAGGTRRVEIPTYAMPRVAKRSAGYHAEPGMDLLDLFVGSEGTLGVITSLRLRVASDPPRLLGWLPVASEPAALAVAGALRAASQATRADSDPRGVDVAAIESVDRRCLAMLREDGKDHEHGVEIPAEAGSALLFQLELPAAYTADRVRDEIGSLDEASVPDTPVTRLCRLLAAHGVLDALVLALPGDRQRAEQLLALREAVPTGVNHRIADVQRRHDPGVHKTAGDMIVPFEQLGHMMGRYREAFASRGLDHALWGHVSDGNIHANVIPRQASDVAAGEAALLELGDEVIRLGGCPLSEHGVGRSPCKQELLRRLYGDAGIEQMRRVKAAFDPGGVLAPGVLFPRR